jgi:hypothetical protein
LWELEGLRTGRWQFFYSTPAADNSSERHETVSQTDYNDMVESNWTYLVDGTLESETGESCPPSQLASPGDKSPNGNTSGGDDCYDAPSVRFRFGANATTSFGPCEIDDLPGFAISDDATQSVAATIHGDHLFFNGFPEGEESGTRRLAQWWADSDLNLDGTVTQEELEAIDPSALPEIDERYQLGARPITPLDSMYTYVRAQLKTQGHFQGEGECPWDGMAHED